MPDKVYICGPMRGLPDCNFPAFFEAELWLQECGYEVVSPARMDERDGVEHTADGEMLATTDIRDLIVKDATEIVGCQAIYMLSGWSKSLGATAERAIAIWAGLQIFGAAA